MRSPSIASLRRQPSALQPALNALTVPAFTARIPAPPVSAPSQQEAFDSKRPPHKRSTSTNSTRASPTSDYDSDAARLLRVQSGTNLQGLHKDTSLPALSGKTQLHAQPSRKGSLGYFGSWRGTLGFSQLVPTQLVASTLKKRSSPPEENEPIISRFVSEEPYQTFFPRPISSPEDEPKDPNKPRRRIPDVNQIMNPILPPLPPRNTSPWANGPKPAIVPPPVLVQSIPKAKQHITGPNGLAGVVELYSKSFTDAHMRRWAQQMVRESERIDKELATVFRTRDPIHESFMRIKAKRERIRQQENSGEASKS